MAYPLARLQQEVMAAVKDCGCEQTLRKVLLELKGSRHERSLGQRLELRLEELGHKALEALQKWHFLHGWHDHSEDYLPEDVGEVLRSLQEGSGLFGMDIGGTLAKAAQLLRPGEKHLAPSTFGASELSPYRCYLD